MNIVQVGIVGVVGALFAIQFKNEKTEYGIYLSVGISLLIFFSVVGHLEMIIDTLKEISTFVDIDTAYIGTLIKMLGVTYIAEFASGICKDAGYGTIAGQIEIFAKLTIMVFSLPILLALLKTLQAFLT